jgi:hypothetical protein
MKTIGDTIEKIIKDREETEKRLKILIGNELGKLPSYTAYFMGCDNVFLRDKNVAEITIFGRDEKVPIPVVRYIETYTKKEGGESTILTWYDDFIFEELIRIYKLIK